jgi:hypothetical protein
MRFGVRLACCSRMLYNIGMARGDSGRIVLEIDPDTKRTLYEALDGQGITLKEWFLVQATEYLKATSQPDLFEDLEHHESERTGLRDE